MQIDIHVFPNTSPPGWGSGSGSGSGGLATSATTTASSGTKAEGSSRGSGSGPSALPLRIITHNIRYATASPSKGEEKWSVRYPRMCAQLDFLASGPACSFMCLQEVLHRQLADLQSHLGPSGWRHIGVGRDDGQTRGEFSPVFYDSNRWDCARSQTYWLSSEPRKAGSVGWDAALPRIVTMGEFSLKTPRGSEADGEGTRVVVMSTHFDHIGAVARRESAKLIVRLAAEWVGSSARFSGVFLGGDFNSEPSDEGYKSITAKDTNWVDVQTVFQPERRYGNQLTFTGFQPERHPEEKKRIDFVFARKGEGVGFVSYGVMANRFDDGVFLSDHCAVVADVEVPVVA
ncbi:endonuclease/Exonuclease/phosphatase [Zalerion maritima]|uniref:Endonuclease/Exonuclease/phosphatase n=1 Tax=Zalerion maritima TaxID=339359 RepID=A0AAD5RM59_9PEZI|nr:endonuclease/Exonuclease/phosphatase [Zalerion maritima]